MIWKLSFNNNNKNDNNNIILLNHFNGHCQKTPAGSHRKKEGVDTERKNKEYKRLKEEWADRIYWQIEEWAQARAQYGKHR